MRSRASSIVVLAVVACGGGNPATDELQIASSTPPYGPLLGGTRITLTGSGFSSGDAAQNRVFIAGREAPLVATVDDSTLEIVIPPGEQPGDAEIVVLAGDRNAATTGIFHYSTPPTITSIAPADVLFSSSSTLVTVTGAGFIDENAGEVQIVVDGQLATDVQVTSDTALTFIAPPGRALLRPVVELVDQRGSATMQRAFRYTPSTRGGLLLFPTFGSFAVFFDPVDNSSIPIPFVETAASRFTAVTRDEHGDYWGLDRSRRFGRIDMKTQNLEAPIQAQGVFPTMIRVGADYFTLDRNSLRFGTLDPATGSFTSVGATALPCCGSYGLAHDGTTLHFVARQAGVPSIATIDGTTGVASTPVAITGANPGFHIEEMRFFAGTLYAASRDSTLVTIDPTTGVATVLPVGLGRFNAMEIFE